MFGSSKILTALALTLGLGASGVQAAIVTLGFGDQPGNYDPYQEGGFNVAANSDGTGSVSLDNSNGQCPYRDPACLHISGSNPGTAYFERADGGVFDALSFAINFSGRGSTNYVEFGNGVSVLDLAIGASYSGGVYTNSTLTTLVTGAIGFGTNYFIDLAAFAVANGEASSFFNGVSELSIGTANGAANVRVDNVSLNVVPLPAGGILLLGGLGALAALRRKRKAA